MDEQAGADEHARATTGWKLLVLANLTAIAVSAFAVPLYLDDLNRLKIGAVPFGFWMLSIGAALIGGAVMLGAAFVRAPGDRAGPTGRAADSPRDAAPQAAPQAAPLGWQQMAGGIATGTIWLVSPFLLLSSAAIFSLGHDGLAVIAGILGGYLLLAVGFAPTMAAAGAGDPVGYVGARFGSGVPVICATVVALAAMLAMLIGLTRIAEQTAANLFDLPTAFATPMVAMAMVAGGLIAKANRRAEAAWRLAACLLFALGCGVVSTIGLFEFGQLVPQLGLGAGIERIDNTEAALVERELADPAQLRPFLSAFLSLNPIEMLALIATLVLGTAVMPHLSAPIVAGPGGAPGGAHRRGRSAIGFFALALILSAVPVLVIAIKLALYSGLIGQPIMALPPAVFDFGQHGLISICGQAAVSLEAVTAACDGLELLLLEEFSLHHDFVLLAAPHLAGAAPGVSYGVQALMLLVALVGMIVVFTQMLKPTGAEQFSAGTVVAGLFFAAAAAAGAEFIAADLLQWTGWALSLALAGLFPVLVLGMLWRRCSAIAASAGMLVGFALTAAYILGVEFGLVAGLPGFDTPVAGVLMVGPAALVVVVISLLFPARGEGA